MDHDSWLLQIFHPIHHLLIIFINNNLKFVFSIGNCVEIKNLARFFSLKDVEDAVQNHILTNFAKFVHTEEFLRLPVDDLCGILSSDSLWGQSELELFRASDKWLQHDMPNRSQYIRQVMK